MAFNMSFLRAIVIIFSIVPFAISFAAYGQSSQGSEAFYSIKNSSQRDPRCNLRPAVFSKILIEVKRKNPNVIKNILGCLKLDRKLIFQVSLIDPSQFQYASDILREDENFVYRLIKINPEVLEFASPKLLLNRDFMERATYLYRDALKYANPKILNNKLFMKGMINADSRNYIFASNRIKNISQYAATALKDNGLLLSYAPYRIRNNKKLATIAVKSNSDAIKYIGKTLRKDKSLKKYAVKKSSIKSEKKLKEFLRLNYVDTSDKRNLGDIVDHRMKFFSKNKIIDRNYVTKWQKIYGGIDPSKKKMRLISADSRNYPNSWKEDFKKYPVLVKKIERFFSNRQVNQNTIDNLSVTYLWKVKSDPLTLVFNLYLLRDATDIDLGSYFSNITSLTAIAQKRKKGNGWRLSVVEVLFDRDIRVDPTFADGHRVFNLWDLYRVNKKDKNPKVLFRVEERFGDKFEVFEEQNNGKYQLIHRIDPMSFTTSSDSELESVD